MESRNTRSQGLKPTVTLASTNPDDFQRQGVIKAEVLT
jgi:hypothetical protein